VIVFGANIFSAFTGLLFLIMAARWLVPTQLGLWAVIVDLVAFSSYPVGIVWYWATRDVARGRLVGRTAFASGAVMSGFGLLVYFFISLATRSSLATSFLPFLLGSLLVPLSYLNAVTTSIVIGYRPAVAGYQLIVSEPVKIAVAYEALYVYRLGVEGVILALVVSYLITFTFGAYMVRGATREQLQLSVVKRWLRLSWLPAINSLPQLLLTKTDTYIASLGFGTAIAGVYQPAFTVASIVGYSYYLSYSLYPLLLRGGNEKLPAIMIEFLLLFSIPMTVGGIVLAQPILHLFSAEYSAGSLGLSILSVMFLFEAISWTVDQTLKGIEKVDLGSEKGFKSFVRSNLLYVSLVDIGEALVYLVGMFVVLSFAFSNGLGDFVAVALWAVVQLCAAVFFLIVKSRRASRSVKLIRGGTRIPYYLGAAVVMGFVLDFVYGVVLDSSAGALVYGLELCVVVALGAAVYFGLLYAVEPEFRAMARSLMKREHTSAPTARREL
jgi:O-antigen/teichoic acid export membrane protein